MARATICLNAIVRDEAGVIDRLLASVRPFIDHWVIVDTGSTDGTQQRLRAFAAELPGELHERPWRDFASNRNEALALAAGKGDFLMLLDADEVLVSEPGFAMPALEADCYLAEHRRGRLRYRRPLLVRNGLPWRWRGVVHEHLGIDRPVTVRRLEGLRVRSEREGVRSRDPDVFRKDAELLEAALRAEPDDPRSVFYAGQSWLDAGEPERAARWFARRIAMGGSANELFDARLALLRARAARGDPWPELLVGYLEAHEASPDRAEPLYAIGRHYLQERRHATAALFLERALRCPVPRDALLWDHSIYQWRVPLNLAVCWARTGRLEPARALNDRLLADPELPAAARERVRNNQEKIVRALARGS